jgi:predicted GTPase
MSTMSEPVAGEQLDYARVAAQLGQDLQMIKEFSREINLAQSLELIDQVACRLRDHRFTVAVVGEFKTGKSTFVNALIGVDVVPTDVVPATATLNRITYGMTSGIEVNYKDGRKEMVEFDKLKEYVTKEFVTTDMLASVDEVVVHHPAPYLLNNVDIIDTPGLNDESSMTAVTLSVLPKIDAAILVISGLSPFSEYTRQFLEERLLSADLGRVIFLVNRLGQLGSVENADRIVSHIEKRIYQNVIDRAKRELGENSTEFEVYVKKIGKPRVFGIDAYDALQGLINNDKSAFERSRFGNFQNGLRRFLNEDRGAIVLQVPVNRILASGNEILMTLELKRKTANMSLEEFTAKREAATEELNRLRQRKREAMEDVEAKKAETTEKALAAVRGCDDRVKAGVRDAISNLELTDDEVAKGKPAADKVTAAVNTEVRRLSELEMDKVADVVNQAVTVTSENLSDLTSDLENTVKGIVLNFSSAGTMGEHMGVAAIGAAALLVGGLPVVGGIAAGYKQAGLKGAVTGGVATYAATYAAVHIAAALGLAALGPVVIIGACLVGFFGGNQITKALFKGQRAKTFKEKAIEQTMKQINEMRLEAELTKQTKAYVNETLSQLAGMVSKDVDAVIENTQRTLDEVARQKERQEVLSQEQIRELDQIAERTKSIVENAKRINSTLAARMAAAAL